MKIEWIKKMDERELNFNNYVRDQAKELLSEIKGVVSTYAEIKYELRNREQSARWSDPRNPYLLVINEAKSQLDKEIDATTHSELPKGD